MKAPTFPHSSPAISGVIHWLNIAATCWGDEHGGKDG